MKKALGVLAATLLMATPVLADTTPAPEGGVSLNMKGITLNLGGFIEAAEIYRSRNQNNDVNSQFQKIPLGNSPGYYQDETRFSARQSRLSLLAKGDYSDTTHLAGYYEMDFLGAANTANSNESNSYNPRVRHLYTTADWDSLGLHLLAGQAWSLVTMNGEGIIPRKELTPLTIEAQYVPGFTWARQPQFRIVKDFDKKFWLGLSVENPQTTLGGTFSQSGATTNYANATTSLPTGGAFAGATSNNPYPDVVVKAAADPGWGHYEVYDLVRVFESSMPQGSGLHNSFKTTNAVGGGVILPVIPKHLSLMASGIVGQGIGRYGSAQLPDVTQNATGADVPLTGFQLLSGITYEPTSNWTFYGYYGREQADRESNNQGTTAVGYGSALANNTGAGTLGGTANGSIRFIEQETVGAWWKFYQGNMGRMQLGLQGSHTEAKYFVANGGAPTGTDNMFFTSLRYYWQ